ncbi:MAG: hypothetical protein ABIS43_02875 [Opitutus sp.]
MFLIAVSGDLRAEPAVMRYIHNAPESALDRRYEYHWKILETALEKTREKYGPYSLETAGLMTEKRQTFELENATGALTVMYLGTTPAMEQSLQSIPIPVDKNLGGYCVFLIRRERQEELGKIQTLAELQKVKFGLGLGWIDVDILRASGLPVVTGSSYEGLFDMLNNGRFDVFLRGAIEVIDELATRQARYPEFEIERKVVLFYPMPMYFWFSRTVEGRRLAQRAEVGMRSMIADGTYDRIFSAYQDEKIRRLDLKHRRIIRIPNPNLGPETTMADKALWFDPATYELRSP